MIRQELKVNIRGGIHAVPTVRIASIIREYGVTGRIEYRGSRADVTNCLQMLQLRVAEGTVITAFLEGDEEEAAMDTLAAYLEGCA